MTTARCTFSTAATETISGEKSCWRYTYNKRTLIPGFWNRIHFFSDPDAAVLLIANPDPPLKLFCKNNLLKSFLNLKKTEKIV